MKLLFLLSCIFLSQSLTAYQLGIHSKIAAVQQGLRYSIIIADEKDYHMCIAERMHHYKVPAVSIAVINDGQLEWAKGYGVISSDGSKTVDTTTLFQAASISKSVTALGVLLLVQQGKVSLDEDVNIYLKSWKVPDNKFTKKEKVTLRRLLSHTAGISVQGFCGYLSHASIPSVVEILDGKRPLVNSGSVIVTEVPGQTFRYSSGGITIVQLLIEDITGLRFDTWMKNNILIPCGMHASTFAQPLPQSYHSFAAHGHDNTGKQISGKWHTHPEMASSGLWTTPTDLAHFSITMLRILQGKQAGPVHQKLIIEALRDQCGCLKREEKSGGVGLGFFFGGTADAVSFGHNGSNEGFKADLKIWPKLGKGIIVMTNGNQGGSLVTEIINSVTDVYDIPGYKPQIKDTIKIDPISYNKFTGIYRDGEHTFTVNMRDNKLFALDSYLPVEIQLYPKNNDIFFMKEDPGLSVQFQTVCGRIDSIILFGNDGKRVKDNNREFVLKK